MQDSLRKPKKLSCLAREGSEQDSFRKLSETERTDKERLKYKKYS